MSDPAQIKSMMDNLNARLRVVVSDWGREQFAQGLPFPDVQAASISALIGETGFVIASGPAHWHRHQIGVVNNTLEAMVREHAVAFAREGKQ
ncbi:MAG: hypothetical protein EBR82_29455 [Caulobacteraceae bacterium]|nr:hypothetical protein [Caulobacteraceae bacterium]